MKIAEVASGGVMAARLAQGLSIVKKDASRAQEAFEAVLKIADQAPARLVAAAMAGVLAVSIGVVELAVRIFG